MKHQPDYLIPINFTLSDRAVERIRQVLQKVRDEKGIDPVASVVWLSPDGTWGDFNVPHIGIYERKQLPVDAIQVVNGLELVFNVSEEIARKFDGQLIDYRECRDFYFASGA
jgi:hypothetical protein